MALAPATCAFLVVELGAAHLLTTCLVSPCSALTPASVGHNLRVKVLSVEVAVDRARLDGTRARVAEAIVGDESASIVFTARDGAHLLVLFKSSME